MARPTVVHTSRMKDRAEGAELYEKRKSFSDEPKGLRDEFGMWRPTDGEECVCCEQIRVSIVHPDRLRTHCTSLNHCENLARKRRLQKSKVKRYVTFADVDGMVHCNVDRMVEDLGHTLFHAMDKIKGVRGVKDEDVKKYIAALRSSINSKFKYRVDAILKMNSRGKGGRKREAEKAVVDIQSENKSE